MSLKNPITPPGIDPGTVRLVAQRINHYATPDVKEVRMLKVLENGALRNIFGPRRYEETGEWRSLHNEEL
jgi:hypothetical protein